ncbi:PQQ-binding-like beta-propeller repeat protein [filamentous cyanobacterium LEGE 11480]|uniref:PQQ-binding-like beta-propeller repeat protein n=1 Tax=Romeriopsis navalis LEGE 11480 TaxID=2777977 RepID=A0A928Z5C5_9CYAN|nr:hypothetical protein [Romeriopsis navalis]MBE9031115.1 PQQ-binding-like beta-propeller repeat protein [Romeriopsis navalis LEGE 11480]
MRSMFAPKPNKLIHCRQQPRWTQRSLLLLKQPEKSDFGGLQHQLYARDYRDRLLAITDFFELRDAGIPLLLEALRDPNGKVRELAAKCLSIFPDHPDVQPIFAASQYRDFRCQKTLKHHNQTITALDISPDQQQCLSVGSGGVIYLWDLVSGELVQTFADVDSGISKAIFNRDGRYVFSNHHTNRVYVWDIATGKCVKQLEGHDDRIVSLVLAPTGNNLITGSWDHTVGLWDLSEGQLIDRFTGHRRQVYTVAISPDGQTIFSADGDGVMRSWDRRSGQPQWAVQLDKTIVQALAVHPTQPILLSGDSRSRLSLWHAQTGEHLDTLPSWTYRATHQIVPSANGEMIFQTCGSGINIWHQPTGWFVGKLEGHRWATTAVVVSHDGKTIISASDDKTIKIWQ